MKTQKLIRPNKYYTQSTLTVKLLTIPGSQYQQSKDFDFNIVIKIIPTSNKAPGLSHTL